MSLLSIFGTLEIGLLYGLVAMSVFLSFRVLDFPDLTIDGSFTLGAVVFAQTILLAPAPLNNPYLATVFAALAGSVAGIVTGLLHVKLKMLHLLAGFLTQQALYSINLRILGKPNAPFFDMHTIVSDAESLGASQHLVLTVLFVVVAGGILFGLNYFLNTEFGLTLRATGENQVMARAHGVRTGWVSVVGIAVSNGIVGLAGALFSQLQEVTDVSMGTGMIIAGIASLIIGETILPPGKVTTALLACIVGSVVYRFAVALALNSNVLGMQAQDLNLATAILVVAAVMVSRFKRPNGLRTLFGLGVPPTAPAGKDAGSES